MIQMDSDKRHPKKKAKVEASSIKCQIPQIRSFFSHLSILKLMQVLSLRGEAQSLGTLLYWLQGLGRVT